MSSEIVVILIMSVLAVGSLFYLEIDSRRKKRREEERAQSVDKD